MSSKRPRQSIRRAAVLGKEYRDVAYTPQFALGILCANEADQQKCFRQLSRQLPGREIKVLVI